ncbi:hypothetical protein B0T22DRAFT_493661 [Podospora appendiculata]|uniref:Uncharacterized protein n=1 Tax=Podospora appendiculata TaxID=314037 RepID=A0AAE0X3L8_9PEZI|nr:hypothetical protein B0T22DRAFT_493661 [Podospora appendiculata]
MSAPFTSCHQQDPPTQHDEMTQHEKTKNGIHSLTRDEILLHLRGELEYEHRRHVYEVNVLRHHGPMSRACDRLPMSPEYTDSAQNCCNKSFPAYFIRSPNLSRRSGPPPRGYVSGAVMMIVHNYIYRKWFRPYRSHIEYGRYLVNFIKPGYNTRASGGGSHPGLAAHLDMHVLQPLFRALILLVHVGNLDDQDSQTVGEMPVLMVLTGEEADLSAPISFDSIQQDILAYHDVEVHPPGKVVEATLETAVAFMMALEQREATAFGPQLHPGAYDSPDCFYWTEEEVKGLGWKEDEWGRVTGSSTTWVVANADQEWTGRGAERDRAEVTTFERSAVNRAYPTIIY